MKVKLENKTIEVKKLPLGKYAELLKALETLPTQISGLDSGSPAEIMANLPQIIGNCLPDVIHIISIASPLDKDEIEQMGLDEVVQVVEAIVEVNRYKDIYDRIKKKMANQRENQNPSIGSGKQ